MFLQDGSAQKFAFSNRQGAGSRICMLRGNIFLSKGCARFFLSRRHKRITAFTAQIQEAARLAAG